MLVRPVVSEESNPQKNRQTHTHTDRIALYRIDVGGFRYKNVINFQKSSRCYEVGLKTEDPVNQAIWQNLGRAIAKGMGKIRPAC